MGLPQPTIIFLSVTAAAIICDAQAQVVPLVYQVSLPVIPVSQVSDSEQSVLPDQAIASSDQVSVLSAEDVSNLVSPFTLLARQAPHKPDCPYCDSSIYPYCSEKLLHDACCCLSPYETGLPPQCQLADCSFLHANSCKEHRLITRCCCDRRIGLPTLYAANRFR